MEINEKDIAHSMSNQIFCCTLVTHKAKDMLILFSNHFFTSPLSPLPPLPLSLSISTYTLSRSSLPSTSDRPAAMTTNEEGPGAAGAVAVSIVRDDEMPLPRRGSSLEEEEVEEERPMERRMEGSIIEERMMEEEECNGDNNDDDDASSDISTLIVPYPELAPVIFFCLKQTTFPRSWCIRAVSSPYPLTL